MTSRDEPTSLADEMSRQERSRRVVIVLFMMGLTFWDTLNLFFYFFSFEKSFFVLEKQFLLFRLQLRCRLGRPDERPRSADERSRRDKLTRWADDLSRRSEQTA